MKKIINKITSRFAIISELLGFFGRRKLWWIIPIIVVLLVIGLLIVFAQTSPLAPFMYPLF